MTNSALLYCGVVFIWGSTWFAIRFQVETVAPELSLVYRFGIAAMLLLVWCKIRGLKMPTGLKNHVLCLILGISLFSFNYLFFYLAALKLTTGLLAVIFSTMTVMNILNGAVILRHSLDLRVTLGAVFGLAGICLVFLPELISLDRREGVVSAVLLSILATYLASLGNITSSYNQTSGIDVIPGNALAMLYGTFIMALYSWIAQTSINFDSSFHYIASLLYLSLFGSALAFTWYLTLIGRIGPERAAYATVLMPVVALVISTLFEDYQWSILGAVGVALVITGNIIVLTGQRQLPQHS
ncbi:MAG: EamA family transporter [Acidiferrobacteraceae bacterium]|nr:EamA family transporter [Acidiferrobacteraceae bacterium]